MSTQIYFYTHIIVSVHLNLSQISYIQYPQYTYTTIYRDRTAPRYYFHILIVLIL